jgi:hypothetical protein
MDAKSSGANEMRGFFRHIGVKSSQDSRLSSEPFLISSFANQKAPKLNKLLNQNIFPSPPPSPQWGEGKGEEGQMKWSYQKMPMRWLQGSTGVPLEPF